MCKTLKLGLLAFAVMGIAFLGCDKLNTPNTPDQPGKVAQNDFPYTTELVTDQGNVAGNVTVSATADYIYVRYVTTGNWYLTGYQLDLQDHSDNGWAFPVTLKGSPIPDQFGYCEVPLNGEPTQEKLLTIPWGDLWGAEQLSIAARADLQEIVDGQVIQEQSGWGRGGRFPEGMGMFFSLGLARKLIRIPWEHVHVQFIEVVGQTPTKWMLSDVPVAPPGEPPYNVANGVYRGFCLDRAFFVTGQVYWAILINPFAYPQPAYIQYLRPPNENVLTPWDLISWLADDFMDDEMPNPDADDIATYQHVFWHLRGLYDEGMFTPREDALDDEMEDNGHGYYPEVGDWFVVPMDINCMTQLNFIIVDP